MNYESRTSITYPNEFDVPHIASRHGDAKLKCCGTGVVIGNQSLQNYTSLTEQVKRFQEHIGLVTIAWVIQVTYLIGKNTIRHSKIR